MKKEAARLGESQKLLWQCPWLLFLLLALLEVPVLVGWLAKELIDESRTSA